MLLGLCAVPGVIIKANPSYGCVLLPDLITFNNKRKDAGKHIRESGSAVLLICFELTALLILCCALVSIQVNVIMMN